MAKRIVWTAQARADLRRIEQQVALQILKTLARYAHRRGRQAASGHRAAPGPSPCPGSPRLRDKGEYLEISRVLDRKEAYR